MNKQLLQWLAVVVAGLLLGGCVLSVGHTETAVKPATSSANSNAAGAVAVIHPTSGSNVHGTVWFTPVAGGVRIGIDLEGLTPGLHGFHIHRYGNCTAADASSAGGHYNPGHQPHGAPDAAQHHAGDYGNIQANAQGEVHQALTVDFISIDGAVNPVLGRAVVIHAAPDDLASQPSGAAGARVGCGVIGLAGS